MKFSFFSRMKFDRILLVVILLVFGYGCQKNYTEQDSPYLSGSDSQAGAVALKVPKANNYTVITRSETLPAGLESQLSAYRQIVSTIPQIVVAVVALTVSDFRARVSKLAQVQAVVPDFEAQWIKLPDFVVQANPPSIGDDEPNFWLQWGLDAINAPEAWNAGYKGKNATVFILDTGIDIDHPDLAGNLDIDLSVSFVPDNPSFDDDRGHGTHVAGIIAAADNSMGVIGVAPEAKIVAVKVLNSSGSGYFSWINAGIIYAADNGADVINMSLGATLKRSGFYSGSDWLSPLDVASLVLAQQRAVDYAYKKGAVIVTSAGNNGYNLDGSASWFVMPGGLQKVVTVSATAPECWILNRLDNPFLDIPAFYTNFGKSLIEIAAPGGDYDCDSPGLVYGYPVYVFDFVLSTYPGGYAWMAGTSMASPHVAGVAALVIGKNGGQMSPVDVTQKLLKTADKIDSNGISPYFGYGRVNACRAVTE